MVSVQGRRWTRLGLAVAVGVLGLVAPLVSPASAAFDGPDEAPDETSAMAMAAAVQRPIEVLSGRSETNTLFANPEGHFTSEVRPEPIRVMKDDGTWTPVDPALTTDVFGGYTAKAAAVKMRFSGGGVTPLAVIGDFERQLGLSWPGSLPAPVVEDTTATYREVLPGVDLRIQVGAEGFSKVVIVKTREAAANPALARIRYGLTTHGVTVTADEDGNVSAVDASGEAVYQSGAPRMWDSSSMDTDPGPGPESRQAVLPVEVDSQALTITPDAAMLADPATVFPVYIDPSFRAGKLAWTSVYKKFPNQSYWNSTDVARVGYESQEGNTNRSFFRLNTGPMIDKHILKATFRIWETHAWSCSPRPVELWLTTSIAANTTWNRQPTWWKKQSTVNAAKGRQACLPGNLEFNATPAVVDATINNWTNIHLGLRANESDTFGWKKFNNNPVLQIDYNTIPAAPTAMSVAPCYSACASPAVTGTLRPTLAAKVVDGDRTPQRVIFEVYNANRSVKVAFTETAVTNIPSGAVARWTVPGDRTDATTFQWRSRSHDGRDYSPWSAWFVFSTDATAPNKESGVSSTDYPVEQPSGGVGRPGSFTFSAEGVPDVSEYLYSLSQDPPGIKVAAATVGGTATVSLTPHKEGPDTVFVRSVDKAGNRGPIRIYRIWVASSTGPATWWKFDETTGTSAADASGNARTATVKGTGVSWVPGRDGNAVALTGAGQLSPGREIVYTEQSFTVSAWVRLSAATADSTVISQDGVTNSAFMLQYVKSANRWAMSMPDKDAAAPVVARALSTTAPQVGVWTHLAGVYDNVTGDIKLYVNGEPQSTVKRSTPWYASGSLQIGADKAGGVADRDRWTGALDDVRTHHWALSEPEIRVLAGV